MVKMLETKIVLNQRLLDKFARNSPTISHLRSYRPVTSAINFVFAFPILSAMVNLWMSTMWKFRKWCLDNKASPTYVKLVYNYIMGAVCFFDNLFNLLALREGLDPFLNMWANHSHRPGFWILWFLVDYVANSLNILLGKFIIEPFHLVKSVPVSQKIVNEKATNGKSKSKKNGTSIPYNIDVGFTNGTSEKGDEKELSFNNLPHVAELSETTRSMSRELQTKLTTDVVSPAKNKVNTQFDSYIKPTYDSVIESYKSATDAYQDNYSKLESVPRAVLNTGIDIGSTTIKNFKNSKWASSSNSENIDVASDGRQVSANSSIDSIEETKILPIVPPVASATSKVSTFAPQADE